MESANSVATIWDKIVKIGAGALGAILGAFGGASPVMYVLLALMGIDYVSGLLVAVMGKSAKTEGGGLDSKIGFQGLARKGLMLLVVLVAAQVDTAIGGGGHVFRDAACWFYIANEGLSVLENMALGGVPFPERLKQLLEQTKQKSNDVDKIE